MLWQAGRQWLIVVSLLQLYNALGKDLLLPRCVKIASINTPLDDPTRAAENYGVKANRKRAFLSISPGIFKIHKGLVKENGTVSFEALDHRRYFLRHKNYHFHLEKKFNNSMFRKDATFFILKVTEHPPLYAFELYSHPAWFMRHLKHKPHRLVLRRVNEASREVMDSTFYLAPSRCRTHIKHGAANASKKTVLVGDGTFIDIADDEEADIAAARANDLHVEAFEKDFEQKETDNGKSIKIHTEDDGNEEITPIRIHTESDVESANPTKPARTGDVGKGAPEESSNQILKEIEEAFRMAQRGNNTSYLEKIEKDIENKVNQIAASVSEKKGKESDPGEGLGTGKGRNIDDIEIHTEADEEPAKLIDERFNKTEIHTESDPSKRKKEKSSIDRIKKMLRGNKQTRVQVLGPVTGKGQAQKTETYGESKPSEIDKDIVVTGNPKMTGKLTIESKYASKNPAKAVKKENFHQEKLTGFNIDDVRKAAQENVTRDLVGMKLPQVPHTKHAHMAYRDYSEAHKVLSTNIENLRKVLKAIEDVPSSNLNEQGIEMVKQPKAGYYPKLLSVPSNATSGSKEQFNASDSPLNENGVSLGNRIPPYLPQHPPYYRVLQSQSSTQTSIAPLTAALANHPKTKVETNFVPLWTTVAPGLHVVQSNGNFLMTNATSQVSGDVPDRFNAAALVDNDTGNNAAGHRASRVVQASVGQLRDNSIVSSAGRLISSLNTQNKSLQETFKELTPEDTAKIFYLGECKDEFPKACEDWAAKRYCLTFSELMKRYCKKACKLCNHVLATGFTPCDRSCGGGVRLRMIKVNSRQVLQRRSCNVNSCPVNGGYTSYSDWSECSVTCGEGVRYRHRSCTSPKPQFGGYDCSHLGPPVDTIPCYTPCKGFKFQTEQHHSDPVGIRTHKHHSLEHSDPGAFPEYTAEESNPKATEPVGESDSELNNEEYADSGSGNQPSGYETEFKWPNKHQRKKPLILHHVHKNIYRHRDHKGNHHLLDIDEERRPYDDSQPYEDHGLDDHSLEDQVHTHVVRYKGQQVARMECGPSQLLQYQKHVANNPSSYKRSPSYKMFDAGEIMYDKYGLPTDTTKNIVQAFDSPYKIILQRSKNNQMKILEQCIESDASVNPDADLKAGQFTNYGSNPLEGEQRSLTASSRVPPDKAMSNRYAANGLYEYKYEDIGQGYGDSDKQLDKDLKDQLMKAYKSEAAELKERSLRSREAKPTLREQLAVEREEALREKAYEDVMDKKSKMPKNNFAEQ